VHYAFSMASKSMTDRMPSKPLIPSLVLTSPIHLISFGLGSGLSPKAPGTVGTLLGFPLFATLMSLGILTQLVLLTIMFMVGVVCCHITGKVIGEPDHSGIVIDEIVCFAMVLVFVPATPLWWSAAFATFRFFDIVKIWPANWVDKNFKNGFGVMLDDLVAALYSIGVLLGVRSLL
jgi:phosphatidylglycerophosphatase A